MSSEEEKELPDVKAGRYAHFVHEDALINQRLTWLLASQTLLFAAYGLTLGSPHTNKVTIETIASCISWLGFWVAFVLFIGIFAAAWAQRIIWVDSNTKPDGSRREKNDPLYVQYGVREETTYLGLFTALILPLFFIATWCFLPEKLPKPSPASLGKHRVVMTIGDASFEASGIATDLLAHDIAKSVVDKLRPASKNQVPATP